MYVLQPTSLKSLSELFITSVVEMKHSFCLFLTAAGSLCKTLGKSRSRSVQRAIDIDITCARACLGTYLTVKMLSKMAYRYTDLEYFEMIRVYYDEAGENANATVRFYGEFSVPNLVRRGIENPAVPTVQTVINVVYRYYEYGQVRVPNHALPNGRPPRYSEDLNDRILAYFERNPGGSTRRAAVRFGVSHLEST